jgi:phage terminase large subunit
MSCGITDPASINWKNPNYVDVYEARIAALKRLRADPSMLPGLRDYYREHPADFISDWGMTYEPRNAERGLPTYIPFVLFERQREWVDWVMEHWRAGKPGITEKSRDCGLSWLSMALACTLCLFNDGVAIGVGSRKAEYVDKLGAMKPLLPKARIFMEHLPREFRSGWLAWRDAPLMRISFPETQSFIGGEGGDELGRGDRTSLYLIDEYAFFERPELTERSLSQTTNCRIDISSVNGMNNPFARKVHEGKVDVFRFRWQQDPRKDDEWYRLLSAPASEGGRGFDPITIAQEVDCDYSASVEGIVIPGAWVRSAIDAHLKLGYPEPTGARGMSLDVADEGVDRNAACVTKGVLIEWAEDWSGKGGDIFQTVERAFRICDERGLDEFDYDADGLGAGVRGDARIINQRRAHAGQRQVAAVGFRGSEAVVDPDKLVEGTMGREGDRGRTNADYFANRKAQGWWALRRRFQLTHRWIAEGIACPFDDTISISSKFPLCMNLVAELSQATYSVNAVGKIVIEKQPNGMKSPNLGDAAMQRFAPKARRPVAYTREMVTAIVRAGRRPRV